MNAKEYTISGTIRTNLGDNPLSGYMYLNGIPYTESDGSGSNLRWDVFYRACYVFIVDGNNEFSGYCMMRVRLPAAAGLFDTAQYFPCRLLSNCGNSFDCCRAHYITPNDATFYHSNGNPYGREAADYEDYLTPPSKISFPHITFEEQKDGSPLASGDNIELISHDSNVLPPTNFTRK